LPVARHRTLAPFSAVDPDDVSNLYSTVHIRNTVGRVSVV
jgi:hypothetical protein